MSAKLALALLIATLLGGCLHCQEQSQNSRAAGACGFQSKF